MTTTKHYLEFTTDVDTEYISKKILSLLQTIHAKQISYTSMEVTKQ